MYLLVNKIYYKGNSIIKLIIVFICALSQFVLAEGYFISIGNGGHRMYSIDGIKWQHHEFISKPGHDQNDLKDIAHGNGITIVVGGFYKSNIFLTKDGKNWGKTNFNIGTLSGIIFINRKFYIFSEGGRIAESKDGKQWSKLSGNVVKEWVKDRGMRFGIGKLKANIRMWKYGNGVFVGAGDNGVICMTKDFKGFHIQKVSDKVKRFRLACNSHVFVAADNIGGKYAYVSKDGKEWKNISTKLNGSDKIKDILFDGDRFILKIQDYGLESKDGESWKKIKGATFPGSLIVTPKAYFSAGHWSRYTDNPQVSFDKGKTWTECKFPSKSTMRYVLYIED